MDKKFLTIIMPVYNGSDTIEKALYSIYIQREYVYEILVCDDHSNDDTLECIKNFLQDYKLPLKILKLPYFTNQGPGLARNFGLKNTKGKGKFVCFLDADDEFEKDSFKNVYEYIQRNPQARIIRGIINHCKKNGDTIRLLAALDCWVHGKFYQLDFIKDNDILFGSFFANEDVCFNNRFRYKLLDTDNFDMNKTDIEIRLPLYKWIYKKDSITHKQENDRKYEEQYMDCMVKAYYYPAIEFYFSDIKVLTRETIIEDIIHRFILTYDFFFSSYDHSIYQKNDEIYLKNLAQLKEFYKDLPRFKITKEMLQDEYAKTHQDAVAINAVVAKTAPFYFRDMITFDNFLDMLNE